MKKIFVSLFLVGLVAAGCNNTSSVGQNQNPSQNHVSNVSTIDSVPPKIVTDADCANLQPSTNVNEETVCINAQPVSGFYTPSTVPVPIVGKVWGNIQEVSLNSIKLNIDSDGNINQTRTIYLENGSNNLSVRATDNSNNSSSAKLSISVVPMNGANGFKTYNNVNGNEVPSPISPKINPQGYVPSGATARCADGDYSFSQHRQGTCSGHGGVSQWLY